MRRSHTLTASLLAWGLVLLLSSAAAAQVLRPSESIYFQLRGGATVYSGDLEEDTFSDPGFGVGLEAGYHFNPALSFGLGGMYHEVPMRDGIRFEDGEEVAQEQSGQAYQLQGLLRYLPLAGRISPFVELGGALVFGQGTEAGRGNGEADDNIIGYGPVAGLGLDIALTSQLGFTLGAQSTFVFPDVALDNADPSAFGDVEDDAAYDILSTLHGGVRYALRAPYTPVEITRLDCPAELTAGERGTFSLDTNPNATQPVSISWDWDDGTTGAGRTASHTYRTPGTYTVAAQASGDYNEAMSTCLVTVIEPQIAPVLSACRVSMTQVDLGESVSFDGSVNIDATAPVSISLDWGDGTMGSGLPAAHNYGQTGTYSVIATATNAYGSDSCQATVSVVQSACFDVSELNSVNFEFGSSALTADAVARLDENLTLLSRCPDLCVLIQAYTDDREGDQLRLSQRRADAIRDYYVSRGVELGNLRAEGRGADPSADSKEDPGPGDSRARRGDSIPADCGTFAPTGRSRR